MNVQKYKYKYKNININVQKITYLYLTSRFLYYFRVFLLFDSFFVNFGAFLRFQEIEDGASKMDPHFETVMQLSRLLTSFFPFRTSEETPLDLLSTFLFEFS